MRQQGRITTWNDDKGFGFITRNDGGPTVFVHVKAFSNRQRRPRGDEIVTYRVVTDTHGRARATDVAFVGDRPSRVVAAAPGNARALFAACFGVALVAAVLAGKLPITAFAYVAIASIVTFFAYGLDKAAARTNRWRTQESTLHLLSLAGGWPGAAIAQCMLRHKTRKEGFQAVFWTTVIVNIGALCWLLSPYGESVLRALHGAAG